MSSGTKTVLLTACLMTQASPGVSHAQASPSAELPVGELKTFRDWVVACDNTLRCLALSLAESNEFAGMVRIERDAGPPGEVVMAFAVEGSNPVDVVVDGARAVRGAEAASVAAAVAAGAKLELRVAGADTAAPSLAGSSAALRYIDDIQKRAGTTTAIVAKGSAPASSVPAAPAAPLIGRVPPDANARPSPLSAEERAAFPREDGCSDEIELSFLSATHTLALVACEGGRYNTPYSVLVGSGEAGRRTFADARFDWGPGPGVAGEDGATLYNAGWDAAKGRLAGSFLGRALADCGDGKDYVWDGAQFRLIGATIMTECRGASEWLPVWRADTQP